MSQAFMKMLRYFNKSFTLYSAFILSLFAIDRITKIYVIHLDRINLQNFILKSEYLNIRLFWNEGIAFGLLQLQEDNFYNILTTIIIFIILIILFMILRNRGFRKFSLILIFLELQAMSMTEYFLKLFQILLIFIQESFIGLFLMQLIYL